MAGIIGQEDFYTVQIAINLFKISNLFTGYSPAFNIHIYWHSNGNTLYRWVLRQLTIFVDQYLYHEFARI